MRQIGQNISQILQKLFYKVADKGQVKIAIHRFITIRTYAKTLL